VHTKFISNTPISIT